MSDVTTLFDLLDERGHVVALDANGQLPVADMDGEPLIPLGEWAAMHGIRPATARQKAGRGMLKTARKVGRDWMISPNEPNTDHRYADQVPAITGPVNPGKVLYYLLKLDGRTLPDRWNGVEHHQDYCRDIFFGLRQGLSGNERLLFDRICDAMADRPNAEVYDIAHASILTVIRDEAFEDMDIEEVDFEDYLRVLSEICHNLLTHAIDLKHYATGQTIMMTWFKSITWSGQREGSLYFVPSEFFRLVIFGMQ